MLISVVVGVLMGVVVYVVANSVIGSIDTSEFSSAEESIVGVLPVVLGIVAVIGAFAAFSRSWGGNGSESAYNGRELLERIEEEENGEEEEEEEEEKEEEVPEPAGVSGFPQAPPTKKRSQGKPPWAI